MALGLAVVVLTRRWWRADEPFVFVSRAADYADEASTWRLRWRGLPTQFMVAALSCFALAFTNPRVSLPGASEPSAPRAIPTRGLAFYLLLDHSGSMRQTAVESVTDEGLPITKMTLLKQVTNAFIAQRPNDLLGLVAFARTADILAPLTLDHQAIRQTLARVQVVENRADDGTGIGYAIFKTVSSVISTKHFGEQLKGGAKPSYTIDRVVLILLTDGFQAPNPLDNGDWMRTMPMEDAAAFAKAHEVKVYLINIDAKIREDKFQPHRNLLKRVAQVTGGNFFIADNPDLLKQVFAEIDLIETDLLPAEAEIVEQTPTEKHWLRLYPALILLGLVCFGLSIALYTTVLRRIP